jgi:hypothetical protein
LRQQLPAATDLETAITYLRLQAFRDRGNAENVSIFDPVRKLVGAGWRLGKETRKAKRDGTEGAEIAEKPIDRSFSKITHCPDAAPLEFAISPCLNSVSAISALSAVKYPGEGSRRETIRASLHL